MDVVDSAFESPNKCRRLFLGLSFLIGLLVAHWVRQGPFAVYLLAGCALFKRRALLLLLCPVVDELSLTKNWSSNVTESKDRSDTGDISRLNALTIAFSKNRIASVLDSLNKF